MSSGSGIGMCTYTTPSGRRCTREAIKYDGESRACCGRTHEPPARSEKLDRNGECPCGSGVKLKKCCRLRIP